jgi:LCP family protein required for cell wall assembly
VSRREKREKEEQEEKERKKRNKNSKTKNKIEKKKKDGVFKKILKTILKTILILILLIILLIGCFIGYLGFTNNWDWNKMLKKGAKQVALLATGQTEADLANLDPIYCLVLGISTDEGIELTDTIMVCAYYPRTQQASMLSIPRDTFVGKSEATAGGNDKINARYQVSGISGILSSVNKLTGLNIENYVIIRNGGLIDLVDAIGGVEFDVPINMNYDDPGQELAIHLVKGKQKLNGSQAEGLVRFRHNNDGTSYPVEYGDNDLGRMRTQREFITETLKQTLKFKNVTKINELIEIAYQNIETNLDMNYVMKYSPAAIEFDTSAIQTEYLPGASAMFGKPQPGSPQGLSFYRADKTKIKNVIQELFTFKQQQYDSGAEVSIIQPSNIKIQLLNATQDEKLLETTQKRLEEKGYNIENTGITTIAKTTKIINRTEKKEEVVDELIDTLGYGDEVKGKSKQECDFTIVIGEDMKQYQN